MGFREASIWFTSVKRNMKIYRVQLSSNDTRVHLVFLLTMIYVLITKNVILGIGIRLWHKYWIFATVYIKQALRIMDMFYPWFLLAWLLLPSSSHWTHKQCDTMQTKIWQQAALHRLMVLVLCCFRQIRQWKGV